jgi:hypothetical protein
MPCPCSYAGCGSRSAPGYRYCSTHVAKVRAEMVESRYLTPHVATRHGGEPRSEIFADGWSLMGRGQRRKGRAHCA